MHPQLPHLFEERGFLRARIAMRRKALVEHGKTIERLCAAGDGIYSMTRWVKRHWLALGLGSCATVLILRPKRFPRLFRWTRRAFGLWSLGKKLLSRLTLLRLLFRLT